MTGQRQAMPNSSFSVANATIEGTKEYEYVMLTIEALAEQLLKVPGSRSTDNFQTLS